MIASLALRGLGSLRVATCAICLLVASAVQAQSAAAGVTTRGTLTVAPPSAASTTVLSGRAKGVLTVTPPAPKVSGEIKGKASACPCAASTK
jgi:hypothetical protein